MFDRNKIKLNHIKAFKKNHKRVKKFFEASSEILIEKEQYYKEINEN